MVRLGVYMLWVFKGIFHPLKNPLDPVRRGTERNTVIPTAQMATMQPMMILRFAFMFIKSFGYDANVKHSYEVEFRVFRIRIQMKLLNLRKYISQTCIIFAEKESYGSK